MEGSGCRPSCDSLTRTTSPDIVLLPWESVDIHCPQTKSGEELCHAGGGGHEDCVCRRSGCCGMLPPAVWDCEGARTDCSPADGNAIIARSTPNH
eukprot:scaffold1446_cov391-Prasinococcus_capsulatus_cf.AAC.15